MNIPTDWKPTPENINSLPEPLRDYIHDIETLCSHAEMVRENIYIREQNKQMIELLTYVVKYKRVREKEILKIIEPPTKPEQEGCPDCINGSVLGDGLSFRGYTKCQTCKGTGKKKMAKKMVKMEIIMNDKQAQALAEQIVDHLGIWGNDESERGITVAGIKQLILQTESKPKQKNCPTDITCQNGYIYPFGYKPVQCSICNKNGKKDGKKGDKKGGNSE